MFTNNTFVAAYGIASKYAADLTDRLENLGEELTLYSMIDFEASIEMELPKLDKEVRELIRKENDLIMWKCLHDACLDNLRTITMNLRFWGKPQWRWKEVIDAASFIAAVTENTATMLAEHEPSPLANAA